MKLTDEARKQIGNKGFENRNRLPAGPQFGDVVHDGPRLLDIVRDLPRSATARTH